jgi:predicted nucleic acid-binding protein
MNKLVLDTNILIYAKDEDSKFHSQVMDLIMMGEFELYTTTKNLSEYYAVVTRGEVPISTPDEALEDIVQFSSAFNILYSNNESLRVLKDLSSTHRPKGLKIHDFEIAAISISHGISGVFTLNKKDFKQIESLEVISVE